MRNGWYDTGYGTLRHYINNKYHNENCPSVIWKDGTKNWFQNHKYHRIDGPAVEFSNGNVNFWYYQDKWIKCQSQKEFDRIIKLKLFW